MKRITRLGVALGGGALAVSSLGLLGATAAQASTFQCNQAAGCGTLHSYDTNGQQIAFDAKGTKAGDGTLVIGYPDLAQDIATSFDKVAHVFGGKTVYTIVYAPNGNWSNQCVSANPVTDKLTLQACTLGASHYQRFDAFKVSGYDGATAHGTLSDGPVAIPNFTLSRYVLRNEGTGGVVIDNSVTSPIGARPDATDDRQLVTVHSGLNFSDSTHSQHISVRELWTWHS